MTNADILEDEDEGNSTYATTSGDDINYIEVSKEWTQWRIPLQSQCLTNDSCVTTSIIFFVVEPHY